MIECMIIWMLLALYIVYLNGKRAKFAFDLRDSYCTVHSILV